MNRTLHKQISEGLAVDRAEVLTLLQIALQSGEERFVRALSEDWLNAFPYDLPVEYLRAKALLQEGKATKALAILTRLTKLDPQYAAAQELLASQLLVELEDRRRVVIDAVDVLSVLEKRSDSS